MNTAQMSAKKAFKSETREYCDSKVNKVKARKQERNYKRSNRAYNEKD